MLLSDKQIRVISLEMSQRTSLNDTKVCTAKSTGSLTFLDPPLVIPFYGGTSYTGVGVLLAFRYLINETLSPKICSITTSLALIRSRSLHIIS